jgi:hypothetical protein
VSAVEILFVFVQYGLQLLFAVVSMVHDCTFNANEILAGLTEKFNDFIRMFLAFVCSRLDNVVQIFWSHALEVVDVVVLYHPVMDRGEAGLTVGLHAVRAERASVGVLPFFQAQSTLRPLIQTQLLHLV